MTIRPGTITLAATGGSGMGPRELEREYLRWGASRKRPGERIGRFGQGGKAAIGHLGGRFSILASRAGDERAFGFRDDTYRDRSRLRTYELTERSKPVAAELGYVRIEIGAIDKKVDPRRLRSRLADTYRPLLQRGDLTLRLDRLNGQRADGGLAGSHCTTATSSAPTSADESDGPVGAGLTQTVGIPTL
jgi:hypothetical protein